MNTYTSIPFSLTFLAFKGYLVNFVLLLLITCSINLNAQVYQVYVAAESDDVVQRVSFDANTNQGWVDATISVGKLPTETDGPHGLTISPDKKHWFVTIAHGNPYGYLAKYSTETHELKGTVDLGLFPASMEISEFTGLLYAVNFNLHGEMEPSTMMIVDPETMDLVAELPTGLMPHGTRMNSTGRKAYHVSMMSDELLEVDTYGFKIARRLALAPNMVTETTTEETGMDDLKELLNMDQSSGSRMGWMKEMNNQSASSDQHSHSSSRQTDRESDADALEHMEHKAHMHESAPLIKPTWADPHPNDAFVYVAGNGSNELIEIDVKKWAITRRIPTGKAPYNLEVSPNGKWLISSLKGAAATSVVDLSTGEELAQIANSRRVSHGVAISSDSKYAFISVEGIGGEAGSVDVISLEALERVAVVETGKQAGGISFFTLIE
tara:strand:- start:248 stop:1561 length:1314 start_codon:yes stop_codon:yes gene_type:complete